MRIRQIGPSNWRMRVAGPKTPALSIITGQVYPLLDTWRTEPSGMRHQTASHWAFAKLGPQTSEYTPGPSNIGEVALSTVALYVCLMFVNASSVVCGGTAPCIAHSQNRALKPTSSPRRLKDSWFRHAHCRDWYVFGAWGREQSGVRRRTVSHCAFAKVRPPIGDVRPRSLQDTQDTYVHHDGM